VNTLRVTWPWSMGNTLERQKSSGGDRPLGSGCKSPPAARIRNRSNALKAENGLGCGLRGLLCQAPNIAVFNMSRWLERGQEGNSSVMSWRTWLRGKTPEEQNPMGVTGMKQGRTSERGVIRRESEKLCGRHVPGEANRG